jgi:peptidyl-prolyl cis-trans isomerase SurA
MTLLRIRILFVLIACLTMMATQPAMAQPSANSQVLDKIIGKVDNQIILLSDLEMAYYQAVQQGERTSPGIDLRCKVLETLVINKLLLAKAELDSVTVESKMVDDNLSRRMNYMIASIGSKEKLEAYYNKTVDQFKSELRKQVRDQMVIQKMQDNITKDMKVTPGEVRKFFEDIPKDSLPYFSKEVEVGQIVRFAKLSKKRKQEAREKIMKLRERIMNGESFEDLAKIYSDDPGSATAGGALGYWGRGVMAPEYEATALRLKKAEVSEPVETQFGYHIIELLDRRGEEYNSRHILIKPNGSNLSLEEPRVYLDSLRTRILADSIKFDKAAKEYSEDQQTKNAGGFFMENTTNTSRVALENLDPVVFFTIDTMKVGTISAPLVYRSDDGKEGMRILYYKSKTVPHEASLKDDYQKIQHAALSRKKAEALSKWFEKTRSEVYISIDKDHQHCKVMANE